MEAPLASADDVVRKLRALGLQRRRGGAAGAPSAVGMSEDERADAALADDLSFWFDVRHAPVQAMLHWLASVVGPESSLASAMTAVERAAMQRRVAAGVPLRRGKALRHALAALEADTSTAASAATEAAKDDAENVVEAADLGGPHFALEVQRKLGRLRERKRLLKHQAELARAAEAEAEAQLCAQERAEAAVAADTRARNASFNATLNAMATAVRGAIDSQRSTCAGSKLSWWQALQGNDVFLQPAELARRIEPLLPVPVLPVQVQVQAQAQAQSAEGAGEAGADAEDNGHADADVEGSRDASRQKMEQTYARALYATAVERVELASLEAQLDWLANSAGAGGGESGGADKENDATKRDSVLATATALDGIKAACKALAREEPALSEEDVLASRERRSTAQTLLDAAQLQKQNLARLVACLEAEHGDLQSVRAAADRLGAVREAAEEPAQALRSKSCPQPQPSGWDARNGDRGRWTRLEAGGGGAEEMQLPAQARTELKSLQASTRALEEENRALTSMGRALHFTVRGLHAEAQGVRVAATTTKNRLAVLQEHAAEDDTRDAFIRFFSSVREQEEEQEDGDS